MFTITEFKVVAILNEPKMHVTKKEQATSCSIRVQFYFCQLVLSSHISIFCQYYHYKQLVSILRTLHIYVCKCVQIREK